MQAYTLNVTLDVTINPDDVLPIVWAGPCPSAWRERVSATACVVPNTQRSAALFHHFIPKACLLAAALIAVSVPNDYHNI